MIKLLKKKYTPKQDVQLGKEAASEVRKQYPIIEDQHIAKYLTHRLATASSPRRRLKQSVCEYSFTPVNLKDINAFALPGGPMFVQRGMFDAAAEEAEVAGVMAHELSRVLLRHGTANASKAQSRGCSSARSPARSAGRAESISQCPHCRVDNPNLTARASFEAGFSFHRALSADRFQSRGGGIAPHCYRGCRLAVQPLSIAEPRAVERVARRWKPGGVPLGDIVILCFRVDHRVLEVGNFPAAMLLDHRE